MRATIAPRIRLTNRPDLTKLIPLATPTIINVDPSERCNLGCNFCPTADHELMQQTPGRNVPAMPFELFEKLMADICQFPDPLKVLRLYKDGEPLVNRRFADMVKLAKESGRVETVDTTTNGLLLTPERSNAIIAAGLDRINISIYGVTTAQYRSFSNRTVNMDRLVENVRYFYEQSRGTCEMLVKINGDVMSEEEVKQFYDLFGDITNTIFVEHVMSCWPDFGVEEHGVAVNKNVGIYGQPVKEVRTCPYIFYSFSVNANGVASTCFLDWERKLIIGDARTESLVDIWNGSRMREHQLMMLRGERKDHPTCKNCGQLTHGMPDDIDEAAAAILARF